MALIPTATPDVNDSGFQASGGAIMLQKQMQSVRKADPVFEIGNEKIRGYVALKMYDQTTASVLQASLDNSESYSIFKGTSYASGQPYVTNEATWASGGDLDNL